MNFANKRFFLFLTSPLEGLRREASRPVNPGSQLLMGLLFKGEL